MIQILNNLVRAILLILFQVLILNNIELGGYVNPYLYILIILLFPIETPPWLIQIFSFLIGISVDLLVGTPGMHAIASVFIGFIRPYLLRYMAPRDGYNPDQKGLQDLGMSWLLKYSAILTVGHHTVLFFVESFNFTNIGHTLVRILFSSIFTLIFIVLYQYLLPKKR